jgi:hypothetical protein
MTADEETEIIKNRILTLLYYGVDGSGMSLEEAEHCIGVCRWLIDTVGEIQKFPCGLKEKSKEIDERIAYNASQLSGEDARNFLQRSRLMWKRTDRQA